MFPYHFPNATLVMYDTHLGSNHGQYRDGYGRFAEYLADVYDVPFLREVVGRLVRTSVELPHHTLMFSTEMQRLITTHRDRHYHAVLIDKDWLTQQSDAYPYDRAAFWNMNATRPPQGWPADLPYDTHAASGLFGMIERILRPTQTGPYLMPREIYTNLRVLPAYWASYPGLADMLGLENPFDKAQAANVVAAWEQLVAGLAPDGINATNILKRLETHATATTN
jgi:hypothetical protein